jgi:FtsH-binding integral membrane protein
MEVLMRQNRKTFTPALENERKFAANQGMTKVFGLMFLGLLLSATAAFFTLRNPAVFDLIFGDRDRNRMYVIMFVPCAFVYVLRDVWKMNSKLALILFFLFAATMGVAFSLVFSTFNINTIALAFASAAGMFGVMAIFGSTTRKDFTKISRLLIMALIGVIIASIGNIFFANSFWDFIIPYITVFMFTGLVAYSIQNVIDQITEQMDADGNLPAAATIRGALHLYLNLLGLFFMALMRLFRR